MSRRRFTDLSYGELLPRLQRLGAASKNTGAQLADPEHFPPPDYRDESGAPFWCADTVQDWVQAYARSEILSRPAVFEGLVGLLHRIGKLRGAEPRSPAAAKARVLDYFASLRINQVMRDECMASTKPRGSCYGRDPALLYGASVRLCEGHRAVIRCRSRAAASWALFLDGMGLDWEYEPKVYAPDGSEPSIRDYFRVTSPQGLPAYYVVRPRGAAPDPAVDLFSRSLSRGDGKASEPAVRQLSGGPLDVLAQPGEQQQQQQQQPGWSLCPRCGGIGTSHAGDSATGFTRIHCAACGHTVPSDEYSPEERGACGMRVYSYKGSMMVAMPALAAFRERTIMEAKKAAEHENGKHDSLLTRLGEWTPRELKILLNNGKDLEGMLRSAGLEIPEALVKARQCCGRPLWTVCQPGNAGDKWPDLQHCRKCDNGSIWWPASAITAAACTPGSPNVDDLA